MLRRETVEAAMTIANVTNQERASILVKAARLGSEITVEDIKQLLLEMANLDQVWINKMVEAIRKNYEN